MHLTSVPAMFCCRSVRCKEEYRHCHKKLVCLLFDFGVLSTQQTMIVNNRLRRSRCCLTPKSNRRSH